MIHVLNLGAGVQSTTLYLMFAEGLILDENFVPIKLDAAIFADTHDEPKAVYRHVEWMIAQGGPPIMVRSKGRLSEHLRRGVNSTGGRFAPIPAYTKDPDSAEEGKLRRQCTREYKIAVIERAIRRELLGIAPRGRAPRKPVVVQYIGYSFDEGGRAARLVRSKARARPWCTFRFPLIEKFMTRANCQTWLYKIHGVPHEVPRSACVYCPFHSDAEWIRIKENPEDWALAVEVDEALRVKENIANRGIDQQMYVHRSCQPLVNITFDTRPNVKELQSNINFAGECLGACGI